LTIKHELPTVGVAFMRLCSFTFLISKTTFALVHCRCQVHCSSFDSSKVTAVFPTYITNYIPKGHFCNWGRLHGDSVNESVPFLYRVFHNAHNVCILSFGHVWQR